MSCNQHPTNILFWNVLWNKLGEKTSEFIQNDVVLVWNQSASVLDWLPAVLWWTQFSKSLMGTNGNSCNQSLMGYILLIYILYYMYIYYIYYTYVLIDGNNFPWFPWNISPKLSPKNIARSGFWSCWRLSLGRMVGDWTMTGWFFHSVPIGSMYAIYGNIYHQYTPNVSIYTIHGSYGIYIYTYMHTYYI